MIKAAGVMADGTPFLLVGLSRENLERLPRDQPIAVDVGQLRHGRVQGWPARMMLVIVGGEDNDSLAASVLAKVGSAGDAGLQDDGDQPDVPLIATLGRVRALAHERRDEELLAILGEA